MTSRLLKQLFHPFLMMLMLMPFRASANDIVETFEGTSSIEKGQAGEIGYATQSASLSGGFQFSFTGGTLKVSEDNKTAGSLKRTYTGTLYRGQTFNLSLECLHADGDLKEDMEIEVLIQQYGETNYNDIDKVKGGNLPRKATLSYKPSKYEDEVKFRVAGLINYCDACHPDLSISVSVIIDIEVKIEGDAEMAETKEAVYTEDNDAKDTPGELWPYTIPAAVVAALLGYSLTRKPQNDPQDGGDPQDDMPDQLEMRIFKAFGDTLQVGAQPQEVYARIVGIKDGQEYTDAHLTAMISITGDNVITTQDAGMKDGWRCATIQAVNMPEPHSDGVVTFTLNAGTGLYNNRLHFQVKEGEMHFAQENLTLPAHYDKEVRLPFVIDGMESEAKVTAEIKDQSGNVTTMYAVRVMWNAEKQVQEAVITDRMLDKEKDCHTPGHFIEFTIYLEAQNETGLKVKGEYLLVRFYMGMVYDIGIGYEGYEVGCYLEEYNPEKHVRKLVWGLSEGKTYVPAETQSFLRIYDYDEENHCIIIVSPQPDPKLFSIQAIDETEQHRVDKLGLNFEAKDTGHPRGTRIILRCMEGLLDAPSRIDATVQFGTTYKRQEYKCQTQVLLCSQPRRILKDAASWDALIKEDRRMLQNMERIEGAIVRMGVADRLLPLIKYMHILRDGYLEDYGLDREAAKTVARVYAFMIGDASDYTFDEGYKPLTLGGEIAQWFKDYAQAIVVTANQANQYLAIPIMIARIAIGIKTLGASEGFFRLYDAFSIGLLEISMAELYVNEGGDAVTQQMKVMVKEAGKMQIFMLGMQLCLHIAVMPVGGQKPLSVHASTNKAKPRALPKKSAKNYSSGKKGSVAQKVIEEGTRRQKAARDAVRSPLEKAKVKGKKPKRDMSNGIKYGRAKANRDIEDLHAIIDMCRENPTPENLEKLRKLVIDVQQNKQAMYKLKKLGPEYNDVRKAFNREMMKIYKETDGDVIYELSQRYGIPESAIKKSNVSKSNLQALLDGETITFDRDTTYYYIKDGKKVYFDQKLTEQLYNRRFYKRTLGFDSTEQMFADRFGHKMDQMLIEDVKQHYESFGPEENVDILFDKSRHTEALPDAKKVRDAIIYKTEERLIEGEKKWQMAQKLNDPLEREAMEAQAVSDMMEGNRQTMKDFQNFVESYDKARTDINGRSYVTDNMRKAVEDIELLFDPDEPIDINELNVRLESRGYTAFTLVNDIANALYLAAGGT